MLSTCQPGQFKLFSRCAKSRTSRFISNRRAKTAPRSSSPIVILNENSEKKKILNTFDMFESRQQRENKYRPVATPSVGQYNPRRQNKVKLTWDILKIYQNHSKPRKTEKTTVKTEVEADVKQKQNQNEKGKTEGAEIQQLDLKPFLLQSGQLNQTQASKKHEKSEKQTHQNLRKYKPVRTQVNMSKMTGRQSAKPLDFVEESSFTHDSMNATKSIDFIKTKTSKKIDFKSQISRQKINSLNKTFVVPSDYEYDYRQIRPKGSTTVDFGRSVGRQQSSKSPNNISLGYTSYDFDKYVWEGKSNIYSNTKTHVIDIRKQSAKRQTFQR